MIELLDKGTETNDTVQLTGFLESTIRNIKKKEDIEACLSLASKFSQEGFCHKG